MTFLAGPTEQRRDWLIRGSPTASCRPSTTDWLAVLVATDGRQVYFMSFRPSSGGDTELFEVNADGTCSILPPSSQHGAVD